MKENKDMRKRYSNFGQVQNKKPKLDDDIEAKLDDDIEALWGEDLDQDALDDCIKLATQVCESKDKITCTQLNNVTLLPTYNAFKERNAIFSSTQFDSSNRPTTSNIVHLSKKEAESGNLELEVQKLRQQYEEREGEVAILRTQLQETRINIQVEQQKTQRDCKQKLITTEKQMKSIKTELEFKNLEIANLKQKILDITKHNNLNTTLNTTQNITRQIKKENERSLEVKVIPGKLQPILDPIYPLKGLIPHSIFSIPKQEQHVIETKLTHTCRNAIPYLQNQTLSATIAVDKSEITIDFVYPELLKLMYCTEEELNMNENIVSINKIICTCEQFLDDLQTFLEEIKCNLRTEDILESDSNYLKHQDDRFNFNNQRLDRDEIGTKSSILLYFLSELLSYSSYVKEYICQSRPLIIREKELFKKNFSYLSKKKPNSKKHNFLNMLLNIIRTAGEIRKADFMSNFLCSSIKLLIHICKSRNYDYVSDIFCKLTKELILSRPQIRVICRLTYLLKLASQQSSFIEFLFNKSRNSTSSRKGILYYNEDACRFYIFVMLFDNSIFKLKNEYFPIDICMNMLCFMYNTFKSSHWIHHRNTKECECVPQLYKLEVEMVFRALEKYTEEIKRTKKRISDWNNFFKNPITVKVLNLMTFNSYELTEKYITVFSQYKEIEKRLQEETDVNELEKLNINEEVVEISSSAFINITF